MNNLQSKLFNRLRSLSSKYQKMRFVNTAHDTGSGEMLQLGPTSGAAAAFQLSNEIN